MQHIRHTHRQAMRKRQERNQKIRWFLTDALGFLALLATCYGMLVLGYGMGL